jgi:hypothetical protein
VVTGEGPVPVEGLQEPGLHCQVTPALEKSLEIFAVTVNCPLTCTALSAGVTVTLIGGGGSRLNEIFALSLGFVTDAAVIETGSVLAAPIVAGAV